MNTRPNNGFGNQPASGCLTVVLQLAKDFLIFLQTLNLNLVAITRRCQIYSFFYG